MILKTKGRAGCNQTPPYTLKNLFYFNRFASSIKAKIVRLALLELIPAELAHWIIRRGGLGDA